MTTHELQCHATCSPGLEAIAEHELTFMGGRVDASVIGGVDFSCSATVLADMLLGLRTVGRVGMRLATFAARTFAELERHAAAKVDWSTVLSADRAVHFRVSSKKSRLYHHDAIAERLERIAASAVPGGRAVRAPSDAGDLESDVLQLPEVQRIIVRVHRDQVTLMADAAGGLMHRRGWRRETGKAPLRETLAAAMVHGSEWTGQGNLTDPMCGSGTIVIEAALLARNIVPGRQRRFAAEHWPLMRGRFEEARREAEAKAISHGVQGSIRGYDRDAGAIEAARSNAERAGVSDDVSFEVAPIAALGNGSSEDMVLANPPYGTRIGSADALRDLYATLGRVSLGRQLGVLSADPRLDGQLGRPMRTVWTTSNGGIPVAFKRSSDLTLPRSPTLPPVPSR